jgi:hypothetical protein
MQVEVFGPQLGTPYNREIARKIKCATNILSVYLGIAHLDIDLTIRLGTTDHKGDDGCRGTALSYMHRNQWQADIFVMRQPRFRNMIKTLGHELVHIRQFTQQGLCLASSKFKRKRWVALPGQDPDLDSPWEQEAYSMEAELAEHYFSYVKKNGDK